MFVEERMYTLHPGKVPEYMKLYQEEGLALQTGFLPAMAGYYFTEVGPLNMVVHMWAYEDLNQRTRCREALFGDPDWQAYRPMIQPFLMTMDTRIMKCAPFFVERLKRILAAEKGQS